MITRRHIRLKAMQFLYSYFTSKDTILSDCKRDMIDNINGLTSLNLIILAFLIDLHKYSKSFFINHRSSLSFQQYDVRLNQRFIDNKVFLVFDSDENLIKGINKMSKILKRADVDLLNKTFVKIIKSKQYDEYVNNDNSFDQDKKFVEIILKEFILNNEIFHHILQEQNIYWNDDLPFMAIYLINQISLIRSVDDKFTIDKSFKNQDDRRFAIDLLDKTIENTDDFDDLIVKYAKNWDLDRIAKMDILLIKMALTEIIEFNEMPIKVTFNEYLEISKYYSTQNSRVFINGILDKIVSDFNKEGKINKVGRGLV